MVRVGVGVWVQVTTAMHALAHALTRSLTHSLTHSLTYAHTSLLPDLLLIGPKVIARTIMPTLSPITQACYSADHDYYA